MGRNRWKNRENPRDDIIRSCTHYVIYYMRGECIYICMYEEVLDFACIRVYTSK